MSKKKSLLLVFCLIVLSSISFTYGAHITCVKCEQGYFETVWTNSTGCLTREECNVCSYGFNARHSNADHDFWDRDQVPTDTEVTCFYCGHGAGYNGTMQ